MTLGDTQAAERAAGFALAAGAELAAALRHPERAAAWLRARTLRSLRERGRLRESPPVETRLAALGALGVDLTVFRGLAGLGLGERAALVASAIERFDPIDVETIIDAAPAAARHAVAQALDRYIRLAAGASEDQAEAPHDEARGELADRVHQVASRTFSGGEAQR